MHSLQLTAVLSLLSPAFGAATKAAWVPYNGPGQYYITNVATGTTVDLLFGNPGPNTPVNGYTTVSKNPHQIWNVAIVSASDGTVSVINSATGAIAYCSNSNNPCNLVLAGEVPIDGNSKFELTYNSDNSVILRSAGNPGLCLDLTGSNPADGTPIICYPCNGGTNQNWIFTGA